MDTRRLLTVAAAGLALCGCATLSTGRVAPAAGSSLVTPPSSPAPTAPARPAPSRFTVMAPIPNPPEKARSRRASAVRPRTPAVPPVATGPAAIAAANREARTVSRADDFVGGVQVFAYAPGKVYEVWAAPLRVTTLVLPAGETVVSKAAGDTVQWQIGETASGAGASLRTYVLLKPLKRGLETNLVLTTSRRVYIVQLKSGGPEAFNTAVTWDEPPDAKAPVAADAEAPAPPSPTTAPGAVDAGYRIAPGRRRPPWTPTAVITDGVRTFITFPPGLEVGEAPALFAIAPGGESQMVNYRQQGGVFIVDRVLERAELRLGERHPQIVRIERMGGAS
jgi:type IV secretion system protein VirB9